MRFILSVLTSISSYLLFAFSFSLPRTYVHLADSISIVRI